MIGNSIGMIIEPMTGDIFKDAVSPTLTQAGIGGGANPEHCGDHRAFELRGGRLRRDVNQKDAVQQRFEQIINPVLFFMLRSER